MVGASIEVPPCLIRISISRVSVFRSKLNPVSPVLAFFMAMVVFGWMRRVDWIKKQLKIQRLSALAGRRRRPELFSGEARLRRRESEIVIFEFRDLYTPQTWTMGEGQVASPLLS